MTARDEQGGEKDAALIENHYCYTCASHQCDHAHASYPNPDGYERGCLGCLVDGHDHSCGFVAIDAPLTTWNTYVTPPGATS